MSLPINICKFGFPNFSQCSLRALTKQVSQATPNKHGLPVCFHKNVSTLQKSSATIRKNKMDIDEEKDLADSPHFKTLVEDTHHEDKKLKHATVDLVLGKGPPPEPPSYCCMSGCANCVYLTYAQELLDYYKDGGEKAREAIKEQVEDPNLQTFLLMEMNLLK